MEPRHSTQHPFSNPQLFPPSRDTRCRPVPPSPYSSQSLAQRADFLRSDHVPGQRIDFDELPCTSIAADEQKIYHPLSNRPLSQETTNPQARRSGYSSGAVFGNRGADGHVSQDGEDPSPSTPSLYRPHSQLSSTQDYLTRHQPKSSTSPRMYIAITDHRPPPPPPFSARQMLPPSSPQHLQTQNNGQNPLLRGPPPPPPPPFSGGRDLPTLPSIPRPGSSMSISSLLGSDTPSRESAPKLYTNGASLANPTTTPSPATQTNATASPTQANLGNGISFSQPHSPNRYNTLRTQATRPSRAYSGGQRRPISNAKGNLPDTILSGASPALQGNGLNRNTSQYSLASDAQYDLGETRYRHSSTGGRVPERPTSQPSVYRTPPLEMDRKTNSSSIVPEAKTNELRDTKGALRYPDRVQDMDVKASLERMDQDHSLSFQAFEQRSNLGRPVRASQTPIFGASQAEKLNNLAYPFLSRSTANSEPSNHKYRPDAETILNSLVENSRTQSRSTQSPFSPDFLSRSREDHLVGAISSEKNTGRSPLQLQSRLFDPVEGQHGTLPPRSSVSILGGENDTPPADQMDRQTKTGEDIQHQRSSLSLFVDNSKRGGRISPLPQAVQGAQGQTSGPASDPGIKNEFARMFSGIGSGVGSAMPNAGPAGSGASTPFAPSPTRNHEPELRTSINGRGEFPELSKSRAGSRGGRKVRRAIEQGTRLGSESGDGRGAALNDLRSAKRIKHSHYQHQHAHNLHHHNNEDSTAAGHPIIAALQLLNNTKRVSTPSQITSITTVPANHSQGLHHYHQQNSKTPIATPIPALRRPTITVISKPLVDGVSGFPRHHLGSILYSPRVDPVTTSSHHSKAGYSSTPRPLPLFEGKENSTIAVRIPRFYLAESEREEICQRRALWGSEVYTDDSDALAAAIHSGWIRGAWGAGIDISMLDLGSSDSAPSRAKGGGNTTALQQDFWTCPPPDPLVPPPGKDVHLTLLILPTLQKYASHLAHGLKSRAWGSKHDGVSFMIQKMAWVDERAGKGEERNGEFRRKRMKSLMDSGKMATGPPLRLMMTDPRSIATKAAVVLV